MRQTVMRQGLLSLVLVVLLSAMITVPVGAAAADVTIIGHDYSFEMPGTLPAGLVHITFLNQGDEEHQAQFLLLKTGVTEAQVIDTLKNPNLSALFAIASSAGGANTTAPGQRQEVWLNLQPGNYEVVCFDTGADNVPHFAKGMLKYVTVAGPATTGTPPTADGTVTLKDFSFALPDVITQAKPLTLQVVNSGPADHEMAVLRLLPGKTQQDVLTFLQAQHPSGPPPASAAGGMGAIPAGGSGWVLLNLTPGTYAVACLVPDSSGKPHVDDGMYAFFTVTAAAPPTDASTRVAVPGTAPKTGSGAGAEVIHRLGEG